MKPIKRTTLDLDACYEIQIHYKRKIYDISKKISKSESAAEIFRGFIDTDRLDYKEFFIILLLTHANQVIAISEVSIGCTHGTIVNIKEIVQQALLTNTSGVIVCHNHPSGELTKSASDETVTKRIKGALGLLDIKLLDHIILTTESYTSFADEGWL
ncbi:DNA repair protein [Dokdonia pacifica]|uniref:RadC-like JAB domain-containing protein n=1 Tax=Dokdonia pacifica TaxID=1627892 RepID=A0A239DYW0_9FLAO|nr:JAB domain-containing protein [Dokdonia pacifica]GGG24894.1 DNA repair protein [Dokdonia pacifica]SNS37449.1 RadC-like JAB domain-containing protein [Dokdonia pacifica]